MNIGGAGLSPIGLSRPLGFGEVVGANFKGEFSADAKVEKNQSTFAERLEQKQQEGLKGKVESREETKNDKEALQESKDKKDFLQEAKEKLLGTFKKKDEEERNEITSDEDKVAGEKIDALHRQLAENRLKETIGSFRRMDNFPLQQHQQQPSKIVEQRQNINMVYNQNTAQSGMSLTA